MNAQHLLTRITAGDAPLTLDVRSAWEYRRGHVPGAVHLPFWTLPVRIAQLRGMTADPVVVYCGQGPRAWMAGAVLRRCGFTDVAYLDGHMAQWYHLRLPVETS